MFWITLFSLLSKTPSSSPMLAIADTSSLLMDTSASSFSNSFVRNSMSTTRGYMIMTRKFITLASQRRPFQRDVPMVFGMISENTRISIVIMADTSPNHSLPKIIVAWRPTPAAPIVLAMVFSESIAAIGLSMFCLSLLNLAASLLPSSSLMVI